MSNNPSEEDCFNIAIKTQRLKSQILLKDPLEEDYGRLLLFGHLHAHSLERFDDFNFPHGVSVLWGVAIDLLLNELTMLYEKLVSVMKMSSLSSYFIELNINIENDLDFYKKLGSIYNSESKVQHYNGLDSFEIVKLDSPFEYRVKPNLEIIEVKWVEIENAIRQCMQDIIS